MMRIFLLAAAALQTIHASADTKMLRPLLEAALDKHVPAIPQQQQHHHQQQDPHHQGHHRTREGQEGTICGCVQPLQENLPQYPSQQKVGQVLR